MEMAFGYNAEAALAAKEADKSAAFAKNAFANFSSRGLSSNSTSAWMATVR